MGNCCGFIESKKECYHLKVWVHYFNDAPTSPCPLCGCNVMFKSRFVIQAQPGAWKVGYKISPYKGGSDDVNNLLPVCWDCFYSMGYQNMECYAWKSGYNSNHKLISGY